MKVLYCASECAPFFKLGGLGDVAGSLPQALTRLGIEATVAIPFFKQISEGIGDGGPLRSGGSEALRGLEKTEEYVVHFGKPKRPEKVTVYRGKLPDGETPILFFANPTYLTQYVSPADFGDQDKIVERFIFFSEAIAKYLSLGVLPSDHPQNASFAKRRIFSVHSSLNFISYILSGQVRLRNAFGVPAGRQPYFDVIHLNDWHVSMVASILNTKFQDIRYKPKTLLTIHNLSYKGRVVSDILADLPPEIYDAASVEWDIGDGILNCLKQGIVAADYVNTVSPTYAREIQTPEYGEGMEELLHGREGRLVGILNGIDGKVWDPRKDGMIAKSLKTMVASIESREKEIGGWKKENKKALRQAVGLPQEEDVPLFGMVSRMTEQKGIDILNKSINSVLGRGAGLKNFQLVVLGTGEKEYEAGLQELADKYPDQVAVKIGFDEKLAHQIYAGSDFFLVPSKFEPCGLTQIIAMRYGSVPLVRDTGGLHDTVKDGGTGIVFKEYSSEALTEAMQRAIGIYGEQDTVRNLRNRGMQEDFSWEQSAREYVNLYKRILS